MNLSNARDQRRLVPRWRTFAATVQTGELGTPRTSRRPAPPYPDLISRMEMFGLAPTLVTAAEAVEAAIVSGREEEAVDAARRLVNIDTDAAPLIRQQAAALLRRTGHGADVPGEVITTSGSGGGEWRRLTRLHPHDPIAWVELALYQTIAMHGDAARKSMSVALGLAPHNRHVLRSASRLFLHLKDAERAHDVLARNAATRSDPWLMAAEIAMAGVTKRTSRNFKLGVSTVEEGGLMPHQITELAGALGTEDLIDGNRRRSRKMFAKSMGKPTGNALAQGEWAALQLGPEIVPMAAWETVPEAFEARAFHLYRDNRLAEVPAMCEGWADVDPIFIRPFEFGASIAGLTEDYRTAEKLAERGLRLRKDAPKLLNSMVFSLASDGRLDDAERYLDRFPKALDEANSLVRTANKGLVAYRRGRNQEARTRYLEAIDGFVRLGDRRMAAQALAYLARESFLAKEPDAQGILANVKKAAENYKGYLAIELKVVIDRIDQSLGQMTLTTVANAPALDPKKLGQLKVTMPGLPSQYSMKLPGQRSGTEHNPKGKKK